ncbi:MAG TPA: hypothetical protein PKN32_04570 [Bacteroidales bacterium]|nr:hypothetical protein [Bacteroidales bacterium]
MDKTNSVSFIKLDINNSLHLEFMKKNVRDFYDINVARWQYADTDLSTGLFFAVKENVLISSQGMIPIYLNIQGDKSLTAKSESSFLLREFHGKGIFEDLYSHTIQTSVQDGIQIVWGFTALSIIWRRKLKFHVYDGLIHESELQISFYRSLFSHDTAKNTLIFKCKKLLKSIYSEIKFKKRAHIHKEFSAIFLDINNRDLIDSISGLYERWRINYPDYVSLNCDNSYLKWRIVDNPIKKYKIVGIYKKDVIVGMCILNADIGKSYMLDFIVPEKELLIPCFDTLLIHLKKHTYISRIIFWASGKNDYSNSVHKLLKCYGAYLYINGNMNFVIKNLSETSEKMDISNFYLNGLWTEGFKI